MGLQIKGLAIDLVPADAARAQWHTEVLVATAQDGPDFRGPAVSGRRGERFIYLTWGEVDEVGDFSMFRRAKLMLSDLGPDAASVLRAVATVSLTDACGMPRCARLRAPAVSWSLELAR